MRVCDIKSGLSKFCDKIHLGLRGDRKIVEYLYVSLGKIEEIDIPASKKRLRVESLSIKAPMLEVEFKIADRGIDDGVFRQLAELDSRISKFALDYRDPEVKENDWIYFNCNMRWGTMHADNMGPGDDQVVVFSTGIADSVGGLELLLHGSSCHLMDRTVSVGRMGSGSSVFFDISSNPRLIDVRGVDLSWEARVTASSIPRILDWDGPPVQQSYLEGCARVVGVMQNSERFSRLIVATPLFVRFSSPKSLKSRRNARKRRRHIEKYGTEFKPDEWRKWCWRKR